MSLRTFIVMLVLCITLAIAAFAGSASASNGAFVANHGNNPGDTCNVTLDQTHVYVGFVTLVATPSGNLHLGCALSGPSVDSVVKIDSGGEKFLANPGGRAVLIFNG